MTNCVVFGKLEYVYVIARKSTDA